METDRHYNDTFANRLPIRQRLSMKILVPIFFVLILGSLACALFYLTRDQGKSNRTVHALAMRVALSITLFLLILGAYKLGWIQPTGIPR
jgi:hypothetical protein